MGLAGTGLQITGLAAETVKKVSSRSEGQFSEACPFNGAADYDFSDADQNGIPSPGDSIRVTYRDCLVSLFQQTGSGTFLVTLEEPSEQSTIEDRYYAGRIDARALIQDLQSEINFQLHFGLLQESHRASGNLTVAIVVDGVAYTERLVGLNVLKYTNLETARNEISAAGTLDSDILDGSIKLDSNESLSGFLNTYPDQGRFELQGASGSRVAAAPYNIHDSTLATIELDASGSGQFVELADRPFWNSLTPDFTWSYEPSNQQYIRPFDPTDFWFVGGSPVRDETVSVTSSLRLQFSRAVDPATVPSSIRILRQLDDLPNLAEFDVETDIRGAAIVLRPLQQLRHGSQYSYPLEGFTVGDTIGNSAYACCAEFTTMDNLNAVALASREFGISGSTIGLDGTQSSSTGGAIASYSWTQISGSMGQITNASQAQAIFSVPAVSDPTVLEIQLEVADAQGEREWDIVEVHAFASASDIGLLYFSGEEDEYVSLGRAWSLSNTNNVMMVQRNFYNGISVQIQSWNLQFVAPGDAIIQNGIYENAVRFQTIGSDSPELSLSGDGRACNTSIGRFEVLDVTYDVNGSVATAAIDFEQECDNSDKTLTGFLRFGSDIAVPVP